MKPHTKSDLRLGVFFSPGFYMAFWNECILKRFSAVDILSRIEFKQHREMWLGAIMAASQTKGTGVQHFVGLPNDEPRDVDVVRMVDIKIPSGKMGTAIERLFIQITRCNLDAGETLLQQIKKKNKPAYKDIILAVYKYGYEPMSDFKAVHDALKKEKEIFPSEVLSIELAEIARSIVLPAGTYGLTRLYPKIGQHLVRLSDQEAFFRNPEVVQGTGLGVSTEWKDLGTFELLPPVLKKSR